MAKIESQKYLKELIKQAQQVLALAKNDFMRLTEKQLNWKQTPDRWSIAECLEHLNSYGRHYLPELKKAIEKQDPNKLAPVMYKPGWLGNYFAYTMAPDPDTGRVRKPMKAPKKSNPAITAPAKQFTIKVVYEFIEQSEELIRLMKAAEKVNLEKRIPTTLSRFLRLKMGDTFRIVLFHNVRHVLQAQRSLKRMLEKR